MEAAIPFVPNQASGLEALAGASPAAVNVVMGTDGTVTTRPGLTQHSSAPATVDANGIDGIHVTLAGDILAVGGGASPKTIYRVASGAAGALGVTSPEMLLGSGRPVFAETEAIVAIAAGSQMQKVVLSSMASSRLGGSPPVASHVIANASRLLANNAISDKGRVNYSGLAAGSSYTGHETWGVTLTSGFFEAEARPDNVVAIKEATGEIFVFGSTTMQVYATDPTYVYSPVQFVEYGCSAPHSVVKVDGAFYWLDHMRRIVMSDGRGFSVVSQNIQADLQSMSEVSDCYGFRICDGIVNVVAFMFPSEGRTFALSLDSGGWSTWMGSPSGGGSFERWKVNAHALDSTTGQSVVGTTDGKVCLLDTSSTLDVDTPIVAQVTTGAIRRGTMGRKRCREVLLAFRRGQTTGSSEPNARLQWRDDAGDWQPGIDVGLGNTGQTYPVVRLFGLGVYRMREWRLTFSGTERLTLIQALETFDLLDGVAQ